MDAYPKRGDFKGHIEWCLKKNPEATREDAVKFARSQLAHQIAINHMNIRVQIEMLRELLQEMEEMSNELHKGEGTKEYELLQTAGT